MSLAEDYINQVQKGKITLSKWVELAVERHRRDEVDQKQLGLVWKPWIGEGWIELAQQLHFYDDQWAGKKVKLEPHQQFYFYVSMGWYKANGKRRFRRCYKKIARKNGKSTESGIRLLLHLLADNIKGAQAYCVANKEDQARIVLNMAGQIAKASPQLRGKFDFYESRGVITRIVYRKNGSFIAALGNDSKRQDGFSPSWANFDEYHGAKDDSMLNVIESGMGARQEPMSDIITTAGYNRDGVCHNYEKYCKDILQGKVKNENVFALIFDQDDEEEFNKPETWIKSNPNLDVSVFSDFLEARYQEAVDIGGTKEVDFKTKNLNIWTNASSVWIQDQVWMNSNPGINVASLKGKECFVGIDLAKKLDINAMALFFPEVGKNSKGKMAHACLMYFWIPKEKKNKDSDHVDYYRWISEGYIKEIGDYSIDFRDLGPEIGEILKDYDVKNIGFDRRYAHDGTIKDLQDQGHECSEVIQLTSYLHLPTIELEKMAIEGTIEHFKNPVMRWMIGNVELYTDTGGSVRIDKRHSIGKVDGPAALVNAIFVWMATKQEENQEVKIEFW